MFYHEKEKYEELFIGIPNVISNRKIHLLPNCDQEFAIVNIYLTSFRDVIIESTYALIRYKRHCGTRICVGGSLDDCKIDYAPRLLWNGKEWLVQTQGYFVFSEIEVK